MGIRTSNRTKIVNGSEFYRNSDIFERRRVKQITQYTTGKIRYPTAKEMARFTILQLAWGVGDRFYKLSYEHYGNSKFWWILPWFNQKPLESDFEPGDIIFIPKPLEEALTYFE